MATGRNRSGQRRVVYLRSLVDAAAWAGTRWQSALLRDDARSISDRYRNRQLLGKSVDCSRPVGRPMFRRRSTGDDSSDCDCFLGSRPGFAGQYVDRRRIVRRFSRERWAVPGCASSVDHCHRNVASAGHSNLNTAGLSRQKLN